MWPIYEPLLNEEDTSSETIELVNGFKPKMTRSSSCRPAICFNDCRKGPYVGLPSFSIV